MKVHLFFLRRNHDILHVFIDGNQRACFNEIIPPVRYKVFDQFSGLGILLDLVEYKNGLPFDQRCSIQHGQLIEKLIQGKGDCSILVSPFNPKTMDGTVIEVEGDCAKSLILGKWQSNDFDYSNTRKTVNMYRFTREFTQKYMPLIKWYVENMGENSYYEKVLGSLLYLREVDTRIVEVPEDMWCEIDDADDLARAQAHFS